jgi:hypothetical protein
VESLFAASLHISDFVQTQNEAKILTTKTVRTLHNKPSMYSKIKPVLKEKCSEIPGQKGSCPTCLFCHPQKVPSEVSQEQQEK